MKIILYKQILQGYKIFMLRYIFVIVCALAINAQAFNDSYTGVIDHKACDCDVLGHAYNLASGELEYVEYHFIDKNLQLRRVEYRDPYGALIVSKELNYSKNKIAPEFEQLDLRTGKLLSAKQGAGEVILRYAKPSKSNDISDGQLKDIRRAAISPTKSLVVDAGFDYFIREHWEELTSGEQLLFDFAVPARADTTKMLIEELSSNECKGLEPLNVSRRQLSSPAKCFKLRAKTWIVNAVLKPIYLSYDSSSRELINFQGLSNIDSKSNKPSRVLIQYYYRM